MNTKNQTTLQLFQMIKALLLNHSGMEFSGFSARAFFNKTYGIDLDHHFYVDVLDSMTRTDKERVTCTQGWGDTKYLIN